MRYGKMFENVKKDLLLDTLASTKNIGPKRFQLLGTQSRITATSYRASSSCRYRIFWTGSLTRLRNKLESSITASHLSPYSTALSENGSDKTNVSYSLIKRCVCHKNSTSATLGTCESCSMCKLLLLQNVRPAEAIYWRLW
jgi:hypothetical protein